MATLVNVHIVPRTNNTKTGPLPATYRPMSTCPSECPFLPSGAIGGCYGTGRIFASAARRSADVDIERATWRIRLGMEAGVRYLRDRVVGDVVLPDGKLDRPYIAGISRIAKAVGVIPFGYTHGWRAFTRRDVTFMKVRGYVMNASAETHDDVVAAVALGLPVALVDEFTPEGTTIAGRRVVTCPAQLRKDVTCASCGMCAKPDRKVIVRFLPHGIARAKARRALATAQHIDREEVA